MQTVQDLDKAFRLYVDKADSQGATDFLPGERQRFLNDAQLRLARELTSGKTDSQDAVDLRRSLSKFADIQIVGNGGSSSVKLPEDYLNWGRARAQLNKPYENYTVSVRIISEDDLNKVLEDPFNKPTVGEPLACFLHNEIRYYPGGAAQLFGLSYYKRPTDLKLSTPDQVPDITPALLPTLVQYAVQLALESVESGRVNTQANITAVTAKS
jgi:hypothetical protein